MNECTTCALGKMHQIVSRRPRNRAQKPFQRVHWDLIHHSTPGFERERYTSHFQCDKTRFHILFVCHDHSQPTLISHFHKVMALVQRQFGINVQVFHLDNETSLGSQFSDMITELGVIIENSAPYTLAQNGQAECAGGVITTKARTMRIGANLPAESWSKLELTAAHIMNCEPCEILGWKSPYEDLQEELQIPMHRRRPAGEHLKAIGCRAYPLDHTVAKGDKNA